MPKVLLAVDGSESSLRATRTLIETVQWFKDPPQIDLVAVHLAVPNVGGFASVVVNRESIEHYYAEECGRMLSAARKLLDEAKIKYTPHNLVGDIPQAIVEHAERAGCQLLYLGTRGMSAIGQLVVGSVAMKVLHLTHIPVVLVR